MCYFLVSLGESLYWFKLLLCMLVECLGDCKDKVMLFNVLLVGFGVDVRFMLIFM